MKRQLRCHEVLADARMKQSARRLRHDAVKLHMAKPYFIFHAPQVRFIFHGTPWGNRTLNCPLGGGIVIVSEANNKVLKRQLEVLISILLHKKAVRKKRTALAPPGGIEPSTAP